MDVTVLGLGYIGLPTASMFAHAGHRVTGVDPNERVIEVVAQGCAHVTEPEVRSLALEALASGNLRATTVMPDYADAFIICVPTPTHGNRPDLHYVSQAAAAVASNVRDGNLIVLESTVPPGTIENVLVPALHAAGKNPDNLHIAHCPERVIPGAIAYELRHNARVIGGRRRIDAEIARDLYASFCRGEIRVTDCVTAELVKVVENTYRDVNLAFVNELAMLAEAFGADAWEVIRLANMHPRVNLLKPGPGVGGHCIPVDPNFLANANPFLTELIQTARRVNDRMPHVVARLVEQELGHGQRGGAKIALLGASYKADVSDSRESPTYTIVRLLQERHYRVAVYDPLAKDCEFELSARFEDAAGDADVIVLITDHQIFKRIDPYSAGRIVRSRVLVDTRNFLDRDAWAAAGFRIRTLGMADKSAWTDAAVRTA